MAQDNGRQTGPLTDRGSAVTSSSVQYVAQNSFRQFLFIQNQDASIVIYVNFGAAAAADQTSIALSAGQALTLDAFVPTDAVFIKAASGTPKVAIKEG